MTERTFQDRVNPWMQECFGPEISADTTERNHRFLEEALELVQSTGCTQDEAHQLVDYVFNREVGDPPQEVGGVMVTLAALCLAADLDMHECGETELARIWTKVDKIRAKQAAKPKHSPLPQKVERQYSHTEVQAIRAAALRQAHKHLKVYGPWENIDGPEYDAGYAAGYHTAMGRLLALIAEKDQ